MKTPDGREFRKGIAGRVFAAAGRLLVGGLGLMGRLASFVARRAWRAGVFAARQGCRASLLALRLTGKFIVTVWRIAGALDAALWRGVKLAGFHLWRATRIVGRVGGAAARDFIGWLPTRMGRAYSAFSGIVLIVAALWIVDELRVAPADGVSAGGERRAPVDLVDPILARIGGRYIHLSEVASAARASGALRDGETLTAEAAFSRRLVESYVEQRLLSRAAIESGAHREPETARQINAARERILAAAYMQSRLDAAVTDEAAERLYQAQSDVTRLGDEVRARHIVVETGEEAEAVLAALQAGGDFAALARELSRDRSTAANGGDLDYFTRDMMAPAIAAAAFSTPPGDIAPPFQTEFGWHVLEVLDRRRTSGVPLAAVKDNIRRFLTLRTIERALAELKEEAEVVYYPPEPGNEAAGSPAGEIGAPGTRLNAPS